MLSAVIIFSNNAIYVTDVEKKYQAVSDQYLILVILQPISIRVIDHNSNSMINLYYSTVITAYGIIIKICTCHDSTAVMSCANIDKDYFIRNWIKLRQNFYEIRIVVD